MKAVREHPGCYVRWMCRPDMREVLAIEAASWGDGCWSEEEFLARLRQRNCIGMVAEQSPVGKILGFMVFEFRRDRVQLVNLAVHPAHRRRNVGWNLVRKLESKLSAQRPLLRVDVPEYSVGAQLFFRASGLLATGTVDGCVRMELETEWDDAECAAGQARPETF